MKTKKIFSSLAGLVTAVSCGLALTSCGDGKATTTTASPTTQVTPTTGGSTTTQTTTVAPTTTVDNRVTVTFNADNGSENVTSKVSPNSLVSEPTKPEKENYYFTGWYTSTEYTTKWDFAKDKVTDNITLYAKWEKVHTVAEILELCGEEPSQNPSTERYYVRATIDTISNPTYGEMTISDDTGEILVYGTYGADGEKRYSELDDKPYAGYEVLLYANVQNYNGTKEIKSGWIIEFKKPSSTVDISKYQEMSIEEARAEEKDALVKVTGVVAQITYANGQIPSGFYLVDNTNSIYVYDSQVAPQVEVGNTVTVAAKKDYWVLDSEVSNAEKFGYKGCNQLTEVVDFTNDEKTTSFDKSWIETATVKELMDTDPTQIQTTTIYKVNAYVDKQENPGFTNYYIYDIDGKTGSYVYTQCNGADFTWLDEFDGKICTVYLSVINAKSTATGCAYRFLPIEVAYEGYTFDTAKTAEFAVKYYGVDQFKDSYQADPVQELTTTVSSTDLGFEGATLTYVSSNTDAIYFAEENGKYVMHVNNSANATVTITIKGTYNNIEYSETVDVEVIKPVSYESINVKAAIDTVTDTEVTVKGIVGPSLVNQVGFYLIDETGVIAVKVSSEVMETVSLGDEVIVRGTRKDYSSKSSPAGYQVCLLDSVVLQNNYGNHEYSTASFDNTKTLADLVALDVADAKNTAMVYTITCTIEKVETPYYTNFTLVSGDVSMTLYSASGTQYSWLNDYANQGEVTLEVAVVNYNSKKTYPGCVLAVVLENGQKVCNELNFTK